MWPSDWDWEKGESVVSTVAPLYTSYRNKDTLESSIWNIQYLLNPPETLQSCINSLYDMQFPHFRGATQYLQK